MAVVTDVFPETLARSLPSTFLHFDIYGDPETLFTAMATVFALTNDTTQALPACDPRLEAFPAHA